jgi:hypothetical protein
MSSRGSELPKPGFSPLGRVSLDIERYWSIQDVVIVDFRDHRQIAVLCHSNRNLAHRCPPLEPKIHP